MRRAVALAALLAGPFATPLRAAEDPTSLRYALASDIDSLDPHWAYDAVSLFVTDQIYETLIDFSGGAIDAFEPRVASVVPSRENGFISADGLTYAFPLRRGIKFHDGTALTAEDVRYSLLRFMLLDREGGPSGLLLEPLLGLHSTRDLKPEQVWELADKAVRLEGGALVIRLKRPFAPLLSLLANFAPIVSQKTVAAAGGWDGASATWPAHRDPAKEQSSLYARANGTGPFKLMKWDRAAGVVLERNDGYWRSPAKLATVVLRVSQDARERILLLERAEADIAVIERRFIPRFAGAPGIVVQDGLPNLEAQSVILLNQKVEAEGNPWLGSGRLDGKGIPPDFLADPDVRRGLSLAFDYDRFIAEGFQGQAERARGPVPRGVWGRHDRMPLPVASVAAAQAAFQRALKGQVWALGFRLPVAYNESRGEWRFACRVLKDRVEALNPLFSVDCRPAARRGSATSSAAAACPPSSIAGCSTTPTPTTPSSRSCIRRATSPRCWATTTRAWTAWSSRPPPSSTPPNARPCTTSCSSCRPSRFPPSSPSMRGTPSCAAPRSPASRTTPSLPTGVSTRSPKYHDERPPRPARRRAGPARRLARRRRGQEPRHLRLRRHRRPGELGPGLGL